MVPKIYNPFKKLLSYFRDQRLKDELDQRSHGEKITKVEAHAGPPSVKKLVSLIGLPNGKKIGHIIVGHSNKSRYKNKLETQAKNVLDLYKDHETIAVERIDLPLTNGNKIDTIEYRPKVSSNKYIINFNGSGTSWQGQGEVHESIKLVEDTGFNVIGFNYPGVGKSTGTPRSQHDLVDAGLAQVKRLLEEHGVQPGDIVLKGHSLGGAVATLVAYELKKHNQEVFLSNDRSFSSISAVVASHADKYSKDSLVSGIKSYVSRQLEKANWNLDVTFAWNDISKEKKIYFYTDDDKVITNAGGLHSQLENKEGGHQITPNIEGNNNHTLPLNYMHIHNDDNYDNYSISAYDKLSSFMYDNLSSDPKIELVGVHKQQINKNTQDNKEFDDKTIKISYTTKPAEVYAELGNTEVALGWKKNPYVKNIYSALAVKDRNFFLTAKDKRNIINAISPSARSQEIDHTTEPVLKHQEIYPQQEGSDTSSLRQALENHEHIKSTDTILGGTTQVQISSPLRRKNWKGH